MTLEKAKKILIDTERKNYSYNFALNSIYLDAVTVAPSDTAQGRGTALEILSGEVHKLLTDPAFTEALQTLRQFSSELDEYTARRVELLSREGERLSRIPAAEYAEYQRLLNDSEDVWHEAKKTNNFDIFKPFLSKTFDMLKRFSDYARSNGQSRYDYLLDHYEKGLTTDILDDFFGLLRERLSPLIKQISSLGPQSRPPFLYGSWPKEDQAKLSQSVMKLMGIDPRHCVLGETMHPFTLEFNKYDVRITTRYEENDLLSSLYSVIHEGGHALYELGGSDDQMYTCLAGGVSMGVHESQSRLYENMIGRSKGFCNLLLPELASIYPDRFAGVTPDDLYRACNQSMPSFIRTEADELTYPMHIIVRYNVERAIFEDKISIDDVPEFFNDEMESLLGIRPADFSSGVLQDSHWAGGNIGYFPSYAIGSAYAAQFVHAMNKEFDFEKMIASGNIRKITGWLTDHIYRFGSLYDPLKLTEDAFGAKFDPQYYTDYLTDKFKDLYNL